MKDPLKQGLKPSCAAATFWDITIVEVKDPLKQGLKLYKSFYYFVSGAEIVEVKDPLKQGLKPIGTMQLLFIHNKLK